MTLKGLNQPLKNKNLKLFLCQNKVDVIRCIETRVKENKAVNVLRKIGKQQSFCCNYSKAFNSRIWLL